MTHAIQILIVDDEDANRRLVSRFVERLGHKTAMATNGVEAVSVCREQLPDLILMDVNMPLMNGIQAAAEIRQMCGDQWLPIIFLSARTAEKDQLDMLEVGDDYLPKPVNFSMLEAKIKVMARISAMQQRINDNVAQLLQARKMESLAQLTGGLAHDFNNLLGVIVGNLDFLEEQLSKDPKGLSRVQAALRATERGADITRRMLKFSRLQAGIAGDESETHDVNRLITEMVEMLRRTLGPTYVIETQLTGHALNIKVPQGEFENVVLNLALNSRRALPQGGSIVLTTAQCTLESANGFRLAAGSYAHLKFTDNGCGMSPEVRAHAFEPFFTTNKTGGSGLGLAMVYSFAQQLKGYVGLHSEVDQGTTVDLLLPLAAPASGRLDKPQAGVTGAAIGARCILVVDDEAELLALTMEQLRSLGYRVLGARNAAEALTLLQREPGIDLLLSDVIMPSGMLGPELASRAEQLYPKLRVLLISGFPQRMADDPANARYSNRLVSKPYRLNELADRVRAALQNGSAGTPPA